jgi:hypothetical protein
MNCEWVKTNGVLYLYDELADDARHDMEQHLRRCVECEREIEALRGFQAAMTVALPVVEPSPNLLAASRMRLQESLESAEQTRRWGWTLDVAQWFHQLRFSPALAGVLLMFGFAGGALATYSVRDAKGRDATPSLVASGGQNVDSAAIASIKGITQDPNDNTVQIQYDRLVPAEEQGSINDPKIQQLLLYAARSNFNSGVRLDSINVLTQNPDDQRVREALIFALRYDKNPGVRLKALESLKSYVKSDVRVRDAVLEALLRDNNAGVRGEAIRSLQPVTADSSVRETLQALAARDASKYIRNESKRVLSTLPEIQ